MRSFFSTLLLSNWAFLFLLLIVAVGVLYLDQIINPDLRVLLFSIYFMGAMFGSFYISYSIAQIVILPLQQIEKKTDEINAGDFGTELAQPEIRELAKLTMSINGMAKRLKTQFIDLTLEKEKFNSLLQNLKEGVFAVDLSETILFQNKNVPASLMNPNSQSISIRESVINSEFLELIRASISGQTESRKIIQQNHHFYSVRIYPLRSNDYIFIYLGVILDVTEEKQNQMIREQFFQNASHELKTPITSIKGFAEILERKLEPANLGPEKKYIEAILRNTDRMIRIIEDMMTISKLENQSTQINPEVFYLRDLVESIQDSLSSILSNKHQTIELHIPKDFKIRADLVLMEHLFINLISNASNYSPEETKIDIQALKSETEIQIQVKDQGFGIPEEDRERIFERFYRVDSNRSRKEGGTGLGLSIVKHICRLHGGDVRVESNPSGGSIFQVSLPV
jgi:two-component system phosphate regulon sensor histidine kinase PhoR